MSKKSGKTLMCWIDEQDGFHTGNLAVPGALLDLERATTWFCANIEEIDDVLVTQDWHPDPEKGQPAIFNREWWWDNQNHDHPEPFSWISPAEVDSERYFTPYEIEYSRSYVQKTNLIIWPTHCVADTQDAELVPALVDALNLYEQTTGNKVKYLLKGMSRKTENYSPFEACVPLADEPNTLFNFEVVQMIVNHDTVVVAGQALSHCVLEALRSLKKVVVGQESDLEFPDWFERPTDMSNIYVLVDCCSIIDLGPEFVASVNAELQDMADNFGLNLVTSDEFMLVA